jgi:hypothetical protein
VKYLTLNAGYSLNYNPLNIEKQYNVYVGLWLGPEKIVTKYGISPNVETLNGDITVKGNYKK